jgi:periplasmic protein TonB
MDAVGSIIAERQGDHTPWAPATVLSLLLHAAVLAGLVFSAFARPMHYAPPRFVAVRLLPAGAVRAPAPVQAAEPAPPAAAPKPKIEKPVPEEAPKPSKEALLLPAKEDKKKKPTPPPVSRPGPAAAPAVSLPSAGDEAPAGASSGPSGQGGTAGIGSLKLDQADFKYPVYIERMVQIISLNWFKPAQAVQTSPVVHFQIERDGTVTDPRIITSSGLPFVDRAALRAVMASSPLPPLPAEYGGPHLGIQVVFE